MPITSSTYTLGAVQKCGRTPCTEMHISNTGEIFHIEYLADIGVDYVAVMSGRVAFIDANLKTNELSDAVFVGAWNYVLSHTTNAELSAYVRSLYKTSSREMLAQLAKRILEWITNGRFTDTQIRNAFGLTAAQWTTLKTKMQTLVNNYNSVQVAMGE